MVNITFCHRFFFCYW